MLTKSYTLNINYDLLHFSSIDNSANCKFAKRNCNQKKKRRQHSVYHFAINRLIWYKVEKSKPIHFT